MDSDAWNAIAAVANVVIALVALLVGKEAAAAARRSADAESHALQVTQNALDEEREREIVAQATRVAAHEIRARSTAHPTSFCLVNNSDQPIYEVGVALTPYGQTFPESDLHHDLDRWLVRIVVLPPGWWRVEFRESVRGMSKVSAVEIAFTDQAGRHWLRTSTGLLKEQRAGMVTHYELPLPFPPSPPIPYSQ